MPNNVRYIRCLNCHKKGKIIGPIPDHCPLCKQKFKEKKEYTNSIIDVLYTLVVGKHKEEGYVECDPHGWVTGDSLKFPGED